jgi:hypothetical protein
MQESYVVLLRDYEQVSFSATHGIFPTSLPCKMASQNVIRPNPNYSDPLGSETLTAVAMRIIIFWARKGKSH